MSKSIIYIYGYGNPGRQDDGLGPAVIDMLDADIPDGVITDSNYQLNIEDADNISGSDVVIFVDASVSAKEPFEFYQIGPSEEITFTTHSMSPQSVIALVNDLYDKDILAYILEIRGYRWDFLEKMTGQAEENLNKAYHFLREKIDSIQLDIQSSKYEQMH